MDREDNRPRSLAEADAARRMEVAQYLAANPDQAPQPWKERRPDGWPVADAIFAFAHETVRRQVSFHLAFRAEGINDCTSTSTLTASGWDCLRHRLSKGELTATGFAQGETEVRQLQPSLFDQAEYDSTTREVIAAGVRYSGVRAFAQHHPSMSQSPSCAPVIEAERSATAHPIGRGYRQSDSILATEMHQRIIDREFPNPHKAAQAVVQRANGAGTEESKVKRLLRVYSELFSTGIN